MLDIACFLVFTFLFPNILLHHYQWCFLYLLFACLLSLTCLYIVRNDDNKDIHPIVFNGCEVGNEK